MMRRHVPVFVRRIATLLVAAAAGTLMGALPLPADEPSKPVSEVLPLKGTWKVKSKEGHEVKLSQDGAKLTGTYLISGTDCFRVDGTASRTGADLSVIYDKAFGPPCATKQIPDDVWKKVLADGKGQDAAHPNAITTAWHVKGGPRDVDLTGDRDQLSIAWGDADPRTGEHPLTTFDIVAGPETLTGVLGIGHIAAPEDKQ